MTERNADPLVAIELPVRHWVAVLALLDQVGVALSAQEMVRLRGEGKTEKDLATEEVTAIMAPLIARAAIVDKLAELGEITPEARDGAGTPYLERWMSRLDTPKPGS